MGSPGSIGAEGRSEILSLLAEALDVYRSARHASVVILRFGLFTGDPMTLEEVGREFGFTRERARQITNKTLRGISIQGVRLASKDPEHAAARLYTFLVQCLGPPEEAEPLKIVRFARAHLGSMPLVTHALQLVVRLTYRRKDDISRILKEARAAFTHLLREERWLLRKKRKMQKRSDRLLSIIEEAEWPVEGEWRGPVPEFSSAVRNVDSAGEGRAGKIYLDRLQREVEFESELERRFYLLADSCSEVEFLQEQPCMVSYSWESNPQIYVPDVFLRLVDGRRLLVEIKPLFRMGLARNLAKWSALREYSRRHGLGALMTDGQRAARSIRQASVRDGVEEALLSEILVDKPFDFYRFRIFKEREGMTQLEFLAIIMRNNLHLSYAPFRLMP